jgi:cation:H+ antiporter
MVGIIINILVFLISFFGLFWSSNILVGAIKRISKFLKWKEFIVALFLFSFFSTIPNFVVDVTSALKSVPQLALGDVIGTNIVDLSLIVGISALISKSGLSLPSRTVQTSVFFTMIVAILPLILILDRELSRVDGILLIFCFIFYVFWLFQKKERFEKIYDEIKEPLTLKILFKDLLIVFLSIIILILSAQGIVTSSLYFSNLFNIPLIFIGTLFVGFGTALPEFFFCVQAARKSQDWLIVGDVMGSVILTTTLVLGTVALISPIKEIFFSQLLVARIFLFISSVLFFIFVKSERKVTKSEGIFLIFIYLIFVLHQILFFEK